MKVVRRPIYCLMIVGFVAMAMGCSSNHLRSDDIYADTAEFQISDDSKIEDTNEVRAVLDILYQYRSALVSKDFGTLNRLVSENYYENTGTTHTTEDDYGHAELANVFEKMAEYAEQIRYNVTVHSVVVEQSQAHIDYEFEYAYQYRIADEETWDAGMDVNRLELHREGDQWRIISGM